MNTPEMHDDDEAVTMNMAAIRREARIQEWVASISESLHFQYQVQLENYPHIYWRARLFAAAAIDKKGDTFEDLHADDAEGQLMDWLLQTFGAREALSRFLMLDTQEAFKSGKLEVGAMPTQAYVRQQFEKTENKLRTGDAYDLSV